MSKRSSTVLKRVIAAIGIFFAITVISTSLRDFDNADKWLEIFKALFFLIIGTGALISFIDDFRNNKWPFQF